MKYLGAITDGKDLVNKEYVDSKTKPPYSQSFLATGGGSAWAYSVPIDVNNPPTRDEVLNFNAYHYQQDGAVPYVYSMNYYYTGSYTSNDITYLRYIVVFGYSTQSGNSTIVFENSFTDTDGILTQWM